MSVAQETAEILAKRAEAKRNTLDFMNLDVVDGGLNLSDLEGLQNTGNTDADETDVGESNGNYYEEPSQLDKFMAALERLKSGGGAVYINIQNLNLGK